MRFAISDIHGNAKTFQALLDKIQLSPSDELYLLGDYIDRGPDSRGVIDQIIGMQQFGYQVYCLRGNHEAECLRLHAKLRSDIIYTDWAKLWGGRVTLASYGQDRVSDRHLAWMHDLSYFQLLDDYVLVHAGLNLNRANPMSDLDAMLWQRYWYDDLTPEAIDWLGTRTIVHGHTPIPRSEIEFSLSPDWKLPVINIDAGCYKKDVDKGCLCALNLDDNTAIFMDRLD
ncbi:MAG: metallophosphoesterase family protein [Bacteroidota bacterium]